MQLKVDRYEQARSWLREGRPLEARLAEHLFDGAPQSVVLAALADFTNADGGFGHGLEPDMQMAGSSALCTTIGLTHLHSVQAHAGDELVQGAMKFLQATYDASRQRWVSVPAEIETAPHAPWWTFATLEEGFQGFWANPRAEIVGSLYAYGDAAAIKLADQLAADICAEIERRSPKLEMHDLLCCVALAEADGVPDTLRERLTTLLRLVVDATVTRDPAQWAEYGLQPMQVASHPGAVFADQLGDSIQQNLDWLIDRQGADGAWAPVWNWGEMYPEAWVKAERDWKSVITFQTLLRLKPWNRIEL